MDKKHGQHKAVTSGVGADHGTVNSYVTGFILSLLLTVLPYYLVVSNQFSTQTVVIGVVVLAVLQLLVQLVYFLHLNTRSERGWNFQAFIFMLLIVFILVAGSLWIMYNLRMNMMTG